MTRSRRRTMIGVALASVSLGWVTVSLATDVLEVVARTREATSPGKDMRASCEFEIVNARGERVLWTGSYYRRSQPDARARFSIETPIDLRGIDVIVGPGAEAHARTEVYLPSLRRLRTIEADMRGESFLGTDFNYEDLGFQSLEFRQHTLADGVDKDGRNCHRIESVPQQGWWYGRVVYCVDRKTSLPLRTEYYDRTGELWKIRTLEGVKTIQGHPTPTTITMQSVPERTLTRITLSDIQYDTGIADVLFESRP